LNDKKQIKFGRFAFEKCFVFPDDVEKFIPYLFLRLKIIERSICHICCGESKIGGFRIDKEPSMKPDLVADVLDLPTILGCNTQKHILIDIPWVIDYNSRRKFAYALRDILKPNGYLIINAPYSLWCKGLSWYDSPDFEVWKVIQNFNSYRDLVDFWVFKKL